MKDGGITLEKYKKAFQNVFVESKHTLKVKNSSSLTLDEKQTQKPHSASQQQQQHINMEYPDSDKGPEGFFFRHPFFP